MPHGFADLRLVSRRDLFQFEYNVLLFLSSEQYLTSMVSAGLPWIRLPHINPAQIVAARKIRRFLTGDLGEHVRLLGFLKHAQIIAPPLSDFSV